MLQPCSTCKCGNPCGFFSLWTVCPCLSLLLSSSIVAPLDLTSGLSGGDRESNAGSAGAFNIRLETKKKNQEDTDKGIHVRTRDVAGGGGQGRGRVRGREGHDRIRYRLPPTATKHSIQALKDNGCITPFVCEVRLSIRTSARMHTLVCVCVCVCEFSSFPRLELLKTYANHHKHTPGLQHRFWHCTGTRQPQDMFCTASRISQRWCEKARSRASRRRTTRRKKCSSMFRALHQKSKRSKR